MIWVPGGWWIPLLLIALFFWRPWRWHRRRIQPRDRDRRRQGPWTPAPTRPDLDETVRARLDLVDQLETRVTELENRLDFAERLLAGRREQEAKAGSS